MKLLKYILVVFLFFSTFEAFSQVEFTASVSKNKLGVNQRFRVEFTVNKQGADNFEPPSFANFKVVGGPSSSISQSWINGVATYSQSYIYILEPKSEGKFTIQPATIEYNGETEKSNPVDITVTKAVTIPKDPNNPEYIAKQNIHLVAEVTNSNPYVGEGIYVVYKLYVSENIGVNRWQVTETPQYNGFWNQDIEVKDIDVRNGTFNGEDYKYIILKKAILIPQKEGKLIVEPMKMDFLLSIPTGRGDFFGNMITRTATYSASSDVRTITVKPLPENGKPENFTGAVGEFQFEVTSQNNTLKANEAAQISVKVFGNGNLKLFELPKLVTPSELEVYTPEFKEQVVTTLEGLRGTVADNYTIVPQYKGKYKIPSVSFSYFSPSEKAYRTIKSEDIYLEVTEGKELPSGSDSAFVSEKKEVVASKNSFRYISLNSTFEPVKTNNFFKSKWFYWLLILPFILIPVLLFIGEKKLARERDVFGNRLRVANRLARKYLSEAKKQLGKKEAFYIALEKALHNFLKAKLHIETTEMSKENISEILRNKNIDDVTINEFIAVLTDCDFGRYTPSTDVKMNQEFEKAKIVITNIDKQL